MTANMPIVRKQFKRAQEPTIINSHTGFGTIRLHTYRKSIRGGAQNTVDRCHFHSLQRYITEARRRNGRVSDLTSRGPGFDSRSGRYQVVTTWMGDCRPSDM